MIEKNETPKSGNESIVVRLRHYGHRAHQRLHRRLVAHASTPYLWRKEHLVKSPNTFFSKRTRRKVYGHVQRMRWCDPQMMKMLADRRVASVRNWEYGLLLSIISSYPESMHWDVLDVGSGRGAFPRYLLRNGNVGSVTTLDLPDPIDKRGKPEQTDGGLEPDHIEASMLDMPIPTGSFDLVTSISAIEHLDGRPVAHSRGEAPPKLSRDRYLADTKQAMSEMMRVIKPGGFLYLTTDAYIPELQHADAWSSPNGHGPIWSAYEIEDLEDVFLAPLEDAGFSFVGERDYRPELLRRNRRRSNYRGRYFTTFGILARRNSNEGAYSS